MPLNKTIYDSWKQMQMASLKRLGIWLWVRGDDHQHAQMACCFQSILGAVWVCGSVKVGAAAPVLFAVCVLTELT